jgi:hypothetical protein
VRAAAAQAGSRAARDAPSLAACQRQPARLAVGAWALTLALRLCSDFPFQTIVSWSHPQRTVRRSPRGCAWRTSPCARAADAGGAERGAGGERAGNAA